MCGIAGVKRYGEIPIALSEIEILLCSLEVRGNHATGIALMTDGVIAVHKMPKPAWAFCKDPSTKQFLADHLKPQTDAVLLHDRFATCGNPNENNNNHPMFDGNTAIVHNGSIRNDNTLFKDMNLERKSETDSDIIRAIISNQGFTEKACRDLSRLNGSAAFAALDTRYPGHLMLGRSGNPLIIGHANDKLYFASTLSAIQKAVRPFEKRYGLFMRPPVASFSHSALVDNTAYILKPDETSSHHDLRIAVGFQPVTYRSHDNYAEKIQTWHAAKNNYKQFTRCLACQTSQGKYTNTAWKDARCAKCNESFAYLEPANA